MLEYIMRLRKTTAYKACFKENMNRIGRIYLPTMFLNKMNIRDEILLQLAPDKSFLSPDGYITRLTRDKETVSKVRFKEDISDKGELGYIYINKNVLEHLGIEDEIAVRIVASIVPDGVSVASFSEH